MIRPIRYIRWLSLFIFIIMGCRSHGKEETPTSGRLNMICDELVSRVIENQLANFQKNYPDAHIQMKLATTNYAIGSLLNNDVSCIVTTRELDSTETEFLIRNNIRVYSHKLALDGIAILVHSDNPVEELHIEQLKKILSGQISSWHELSKSTLDSIEVVTDGRKSGNFHLLKHEVLGELPVSGRSKIIPGDSATSASERIMAYIASHPQAIGYLSVSWLNKISEFSGNDPKFKVLKIAGLDYHKPVLPIPGYIYRGDYPLRRMIYIMHRQQHIGLAAGLTAYLTGNEGQRTFLDMNMVPAMNPIKLKKE